MKCEHKFHIFKDPELARSGYISLFCERCLTLRKVKKEYTEE